MKLLDPQRRQAQEQLDLHILVSIYFSQTGKYGGVMHVGMAVIFQNPEQHLTDREALMQTIFNLADLAEPRAYLFKLRQHADREGRTRFETVHRQGNADVGKYLEGYGDRYILTRAFSRTARSRHRRPKDNQKETTIRPTRKAFPAKKRITQEEIMQLINAKMLRFVLPSVSR